MKYDRRTILAIFGAIVIVSGSFTTLLAINRKQGQPSTPVGTESATGPINIPLTQTFGDIKGMKVRYPAGWLAKSTLSNDKQNIVTFEAPGTTTKPLSFTGEEIVTGARITLIKNNFAQYRDLGAYRQSNAFLLEHAQNKTERKIGDLTVMEFDVPYEAPVQHYIVFFRDSTQYIIATDAKGHQNQVYKAAFESIVKNMEFTQ